jgi:lysophospholipase L1-like esterase
MKRSFFVIFGLLASCLSAADLGSVRTSDRLATPVAINPKLPTIFIVGDSTASPDSGDVYGWGVPFPLYFDLTKINVVNRARGGRSSRTFFTEGLWADVLKDLRKGDFVLLQMGHNDSSAINDSTRARGSLPGIGNESQEIDNQMTHKKEVVHTFGWYLGRFVEDARAKGAYPILVSPTVCDLWTNGHVQHGPGQYATWTADVAIEQNVPFVDLTSMLAARYDAMGPKEVATLFSGADTVHMNRLGAGFVASVVTQGLLSLPGNPLESYVLPERT